MPKTTKVVTLQNERANYSEAVSALQDKIETTTQEIYATGNQRVISLSCTSIIKNHSHHPSYVLTAFILVEVDI